MRHPDKLILMNIDHVGGRAGPDLELLKAYRLAYPAAQLYLAGGIRDIEDLLAAQSAGANGVLLASALHDGRVTAADLDQFS
jgi:phosphoribosylformimino-5-aminoimidazole carboxamide ribotide isomerase